MAKIIYWYEHRATKICKKKKDFEKSFFKLTNNATFGKPVANIRKHRDTATEHRDVTTEERRNYLVPTPNYHTINIFSENVLTIEMKKSKYL